MLVTDATTGQTFRKPVTLEKDEGNRPGTMLDSLAALKPVIDDGVITASNASQLSDGASAAALFEIA